MNHPQQVLDLANQLILSEAAFLQTKNTRKFESDIGALVSHSNVLGIDWEYVLKVSDELAPRNQKGQIKFV
jgi:hypothetical protein